MDVKSQQKSRSYFPVADKKDSVGRERRSPPPQLVRLALESHNNRYFSKVQQGARDAF